MSVKTPFFTKHHHIYRFLLHGDIPPQKISTFFSPENSQKTPSFKNKTSPEEMATHLRDALNNLTVALRAESQKELHVRNQDTIGQMIQRALFLNQELTQGSEKYSWFSYYAEKTLGEQIAHELLKLKSLMPSEWSNNMRGEVRAISFSYSHYLDTHKRTLEKELSEACEEAPISSSSPCP